MEYEKIRQVIQEEYDRQPIDSNYNFISRFATAVYNAQVTWKKNKRKPIDDKGCKHERLKYSYKNGGSECLDCGKI